VLHTADIHLDSDSDGSAHHERSRHVFRQIVDLALADEVDLLLIAGDLFDHNRVPDATIGFVRAELDRRRQPVVILPGNHDALYANAIHDRHDFTAGVNHVHVIRQLNGETTDFPELELVVWGRAMEEHEPRFRPLAHIPEAHRKDKGPVPDVPAVLSTARPPAGSAGGSPPAQADGVI
jgi:DNA repair exonuclease SbcCD nuclease subunit